MIITLGRCNLKKYLFLLVPIIKLIREICNFSNSFYLVKNILIQYLFLCLAKFANVIFWFILMKKIKFPKTLNKEMYNKEGNLDIIKEINEIQITEEKKNSVNRRDSSKGLSQKEININEKKKEKRMRLCKEITFLIISSIIDFLSNISYLFSYAYVSNDTKEINNNVTSFYNSTFLEIKETINYALNSNKTEIKPENSNVVNIIPFRISIRIMIIYIFSLIFFNCDSPHRHQFISLLFIIITIVISNLLEILLKIQKNDNDILYHLIISFLQELFFSLDSVIGAKYLSISNGNVYKLLFFNGLFGILAIIIINFSTGLIHCSKLKLNEEYCENDNLKYLYNFKFFDKRLIYFMTSLFLSIIEMACTWLLIFYQTVNHFSIACAIHLTYRFLMGRKNNNNHIIIGVISLFFISFFSLVFNEIIILRFCKLDKNTSEEIELRAIEDQKLIERLSVENSVEGINEN